MQSPPKLRLRFLKKAYDWLFSSLANQLLITYLMVIIFALFAVSMWALLTIRNESMNDLRNSLIVAAVNLSQEIGDDLTMDSQAAKSRIQNAAERYANKLGASIRVVDANAHLLADSESPSLKERARNLESDSEVNDALAGITRFCVRSSPSTHANWLYIGYPVAAGSGKGPGPSTLGVISVGVPLTDIDRRLRGDLILFLEITVATGIVTILISLWLAKRVNQPVKEMSNLAKQISLSGDISQFLPVSRSDEIGELGLSFNQMIGRLREQERLRQEFIANASHELKTPTMAIGSVVEALQAGAAEDPKMRKQFLTSLEKLVERQTSLLKDLLDISRLDGGLETEWQDQVKIMQVVNDAVEQVRPQAEKKELELTYQYSQDPVMLDGVKLPGNSIQLQRALVNILTNAINYTNSPGAITVAPRLVAEQKQFQVRISDTGVGIEPHDLAHIFERFYRADKARSRASGGTGLGLAITREIIARHHGTVQVESTVGKGSHFTVNLTGTEAT